MPQLSPSVLNAPNLDLPARRPVPTMAPLPEHRRVSYTEATPLLSEAPPSAAAAAHAAAAAGQSGISLSDAGHKHHGVVGLNRPASTLNELKVLVRNSIPLTMGLMLENALNTINVLIVGRLGPGELAVVGNSSLLILVTGFPLPLAMAAAFTTLSAPLYTQVDHRYVIGQVLQRTILLSVVLSFLIALLWWNVGPILLALKQPEELVHGMKIYMRYASLLLPALGLFENMKSFLQVQGIMAAPPLVLLAILPFHTLFAIYLVHYTDFGAAGAALATAATMWTAGLGLVLYVSRTRAKECWDGWTRKAWEDWGSILWIAVPGALMFGSELWAFEIIALLAGRLGAHAVAAQAIISTLDNIVAMVPYAISIGIANRVGNLLGFGARAIKRAKMTVRAGFFLEILVSGTCGALVLIYRHQLPYIFTDDKAVADVAAAAAVFVASYQVFDGLQNVGAACLRAFGRQNVGSIIHFVGYYLVGLPLGAWLGLGSPHWGLSGLWAGAAIALGCTAASELLFAATIKWEDEVERVQQREIGSDSDEEEEEA
ncbi:ethionine resistance protein [Vanrija albida]|uniref:Ethionine resistance protein n=1 Tax=Vanrija albida TaxID=181172 RepID=A0ABR3PS76_9TREE